MGFIINIIAIILVAGGLLFFLGSGIGVVRFPDFYTRMHAAGKGDTLSSLLILSGLGIYHLHHLDLGALSTWPAILVLVKIIAICAFVMLTSPTSTHALMEAGYEDGIKPQLAEGKTNPLPRIAAVRTADDSELNSSAKSVEKSPKTVTKSASKKSTSKKKTPATKKKTVKKKTSSKKPATSVKAATKPKKKATSKKAPKKKSPAAKKTKKPAQKKSK